jgi:UDP-glucuronate 4-epimerase
VKAMVTGAAGFIGSQITEACLDAGWHVIGVDCFTSYYAPEQKRSNLRAAEHSPAFEFVDTDIAVAPLDDLLDGVDVVFHQAGQPGVRTSWSEGFASYLHHNVDATQRLLEASRRSGTLTRFVYASSSSVYGNAPAYPTNELDLPRPQSPYGVSKLAGEHLCGVYGREFGVPTVALRYFTVYGPRQRPDMATHRLIEAALHGTMFRLFGDGTKVRDFTFVGDVVRANLLAAQSDVPPATVMNIAGGSSGTMAELVELVQVITGQQIMIEWLPDASGDVDRTGGSIELAQRLLGWQPRHTLRSGLESQIQWHLSRGVQ